MGSVFDRLNNRLGPQSDGIGVADLAQLPTVQRQIMRILLRELELSQAGLDAALAGLPDDRRPPQDEVEPALKTLTREGWVIRMGEGETITYRANLRRKPPSTLATSLWAALDARIEESQPPDHPS